MEKGPNKKRSWNRLDIALLIFALMFLCGSLLTLSSDKYFRLVWGRWSGASNAPVVGTVATAMNDVRHRDSESFIWDASLPSQTVRVGDSLFAGHDSQTEVRLLDGNSIILQERSLVFFKALGNLQIPDLAFGSFRINVNGRTKVAINGQIVELDGIAANLEIELTEGERPRVRVLSGTVSLNDERGRQNLTAKYQALNLPYTYNVLADEQVDGPSTHQPRQKNTEFVYTPQLCNIYDCSTTPLQKRITTSKEVPAKVEVSWSGSNKQTTYLQISSNPDFQNPKQFEVPGFWTSLSPQTSHLGKNYYRFSKDGKAWGQTFHYKVTTRLLQTKAPTLSAQKTVLYLDQDQGILPFGIEHDFFLTEERAETSDVSNLPDDILLQYALEVYRVDQTQEKLVYVKLGRRTQDKIKFTTAGNYILRARGINKNEEVTALSAPIAIKVFASKPIFLTKRTPKRKKAPLPKTFVQKAFEKPQPTRKPTAVENTLTQVWKAVTGRINGGYKQSKLSVEGSGFTMFSADQTANQSDPPFALLMGLRIQHWNHRIGFGGHFRSKVIDMTGDDIVSPTQVELRTAYRWAMPFGILKNSESQISAIAAYEIYRNGSSAVDFSRGYDLFKLGFGLDFPAFNRWDTGGEVLLGMGVDGSIKYEISGFLDFYIKPKVSFGGGYRVHLFEAGSEKSSPSGLPYREGFGEAYSTLRWHY